MTIVAYHIGSLGDTIVTVPALRVVRRHFPAAEVVLLYNEYRHRTGMVSARTVLEGSGLVDTFVSYDADATGREWPLVLAGVVRAIRRLRPTVAVYLAPSERSASAVRRDRLFFRMCGALRLVGFHSFAPSVLFPRDARGAIVPVLHEAHRKIQRLQADSVGVGGEAEALAPPLLTWTSQERATADAWLAAHRRDLRPLVSVAPATNMPAKAWPIERFVEIGRRLARAGCELAVVGGPGDHALGERLIGAWGRGLNTTGAFTLRVLGSFLASCAWHLGLDSGPTHLAAAAGLRCVTITSDAFQAGQWDPLGDGHVVVRRSVDCGGCRQPECATPGHPCMTDIGVDDVWRAIRDAALV